MLVDLACLTVCTLFNIRTNNVSEKVIDNIKENNINGDIFLQLNENDLKEVASLLSDRIVLRNLQKSSSSVSTPRAKVGNKYISLIGDTHDVFNNRIELLLTHQYHQVP